MFGGKKKRERVASEGTSARGQITALKKHRMQDHPNTHTWDVTARFTTADGREVESAQAIEFLVWEPPEMGGSAPLRYDPEEPGFWVWDDHPPTPPPGTAPAVTVTVSQDSVEARLEQLKKLHDGGVIDAAEYAAQRRRIIESL